MDHFYYSHDNTPHGPFSAKEMRELAMRGAISPTDIVWKEGSEQKVQAARVKNLFPPAPAVVAPQPAPAVVPAAEVAPPVTDEAPPKPAYEEQTFVARETPPREPPKQAPEPQARQKRVVGIKGAILTGQDGVKVMFRKKCEKCGHEDAARSTTIIRPGTSRISFFCPKCRRARSVEITATG